MALQTVVFQQDRFGYNSNDLYKLVEGNWSCGFGLLEKEEEKGSFEILENQTEYVHYENWNSPPTSMVPDLGPPWGPNSCLESDNLNIIVPEEFPAEFDASTTISAKPKRRRSTSKKNMEEIENQRMTHIAVERNRRKQMNEYLSVLRSLMPDSYVLRGDQASIIGGAINYVKELEQHLQFLSVHQHGNQKAETSSSRPFAEFFTFPQYSTGSTSCSDSAATTDHNQSGIADIEVSLVESHANLKIRSKRRPKQLLRMVSGLQSLRLTVLHLNVTTAHQTVLYSLCVKVEDDCQLTSVDEIATAVNQMLRKIQEETMLI